MKIGLSKETFSSLKIRNYRLYFFGQLISVPGNWMQIIGQSWLVLQLTNSGTTLGIVTALQFLPVLLFGSWGGVIVDFFSKRKLYFITQCLAAMLALTLGILVLTGTVKLWMIYCLALALGFVNVVDNPAQQTFIAEMVGEDKLQNAVTLNFTQYNIARIIGPAIAGFFIATLGIGPCFIINAFSYLSIIIALLLMKKSELHISHRSLKYETGQMRAGFKYVLSNKNILITLIMLSIIGTLTYEFQVNLPMIAEFTFAGTATTLAMLNISMGLGSVIGGLLTAAHSKNSLSLLIKVVFVFGFFVTISSLMPSVILMMITLLISGFFGIYYNAVTTATLQLESVPEMRSRVMSLRSVAFLGSTPIGAMIIGLVGEHVGPRYSLALSGVAALVAGVIGYLMYKKQKITNLT